MLASFKLAPQGLNLFFETARPLTDTIYAADVSFKVLINMYLFVKLEFLEVFNQLLLLFVVFDAIERKDKNVRRIFHPSLINAYLRLACLVV